MSEVPEMFNVIEKLNKEYDDLYNKCEQMKIMYNDLKEINNKALNQLDFIKTGLNKPNRISWEVYTFDEFLEECKNVIGDRIESNVLPDGWDYYDNIDLNDDKDVDDLIDTYETFADIHIYHIKRVDNKIMILWRM